MAKTKASKAGEENSNNGTSRTVLIWVKMQVALQVATFGYLFVLAGQVGELRGTLEIVVQRQERILDTLSTELNIRIAFREITTPVRMAVVTTGPVETGSWDIAVHLLDFEKFERHSFLFAGLDRSDYKEHVFVIAGIAATLHLDAVSFSEAQEWYLETEKDFTIPPFVDAEGSFGFSDYDPDYFARIRKTFVEVLGAKPAHSSEPIQLKSETVSWGELVLELEEHSSLYGVYDKTNKHEKRSPL